MRGNPLPDDAPRCIERECKYHGITLYTLYQRSGTRKDGRPYRAYRCLKCNAHNKEGHRKRIRRALIMDLGGCCSVCGYNRYIGALHFHHRDPSEKTFEISKLSTNLEKARSEVAKCDLLCANCHAEVHASHH